jgi:aryl-alcohol dehydrogenase-like predicted oxidoreductase
MTLSAKVAVMSIFEARVTLGRTGLSVGPIGVSGGYGIDESSLLSAFDRGVNYFYHGSFRRSGMTSAVRTLTKNGKRDDLVLVLQSYSRWGWLLERTFKAGLRKLGTDYADILLLGLFNQPPSSRVLESAHRLKTAGLVRHIAISAHRRSAFVDYGKDHNYGILHIRYNAAHPGAEQDVFPQLDTTNRPGIVSYTATSWGQLLAQKRIPKGEVPLRGRDCYRFALNNPNINVCMAGPANHGELEEALLALETGPLSPEEDARFRAIGRHVRG